MPGRWVADHADPDWIDHCLRTSYGAYETSFGEPCRAQRFGDRFLSARATMLAADLGARYDLTVEPGARSKASMHPGVAATGRSADMIRAPRAPYRASPDDPLHAGGGDLWMVPLTSMNPDPLLPAWRRMGRRVRYPGRPLLRPATLAARWPAERFWSIIERDLGAMARPYLAFVIRSEPARAPVDAVEAKLAALVTLSLARRLVFTTPDVVVDGGVVDALAANPDNLTRN